MCSAGSPACGEDVGIVQHHRRHRGLPPRVWGRPNLIGCTPGAAAGSPHACGKTPTPPRSGAAGAVHPTRVGKTQRADQNRVGLPVPLYACGENPDSERPGSLLAGSPPRVGKTASSIGGSGSSGPVHPRVWGETSSSSSSRSLSPSSLRGNGEDAQCRVMHQPRVTVHPHACGEDSMCRSCLAPLSAIHPLRVLRKTSEIVWWRARQKGFTPTRVGEDSEDADMTTARLGSPTPWGRHGARKRLTGGHGSPPRDNGRRQPGLGHAAAVRFTPTRVGKTLTPDNLARQSKVHPHACRGDHGWLRNRSASRGSPHACGEDAMVITE